MRIVVPRVGPALALVGCAALAEAGAAGCTAHLDVSWVGSPLPIGFGDGHDGPFSPSGSTVVNSCRAIVVASGTTVQLADSSGLAAGRVFLLLQVQDTFAAVADTRD